MVLSLTAKLAKNPLYLVVTPTEQLQDEGVDFEGETPKDRDLNHEDFIAYRGIYTRFSQALSEDERTSLLRSIKMVIKRDCFN